MKRALIFGASGQDGHYVSEICEERQIDAVTVARRSGWRHQGTVADAALVEQLVEQQPDVIFHLAATSTTKHEALRDNHETIVTGTLNILESVLRYSPATRVLIVGSGTQFRNQGLPISENSEFDPSSAYAVARIQTVFAARYYRMLGVKAYVGYLFHHESPYRPAHHVSRMIIDGVKRIVAGSSEKITIGDASVEKEWAYAKDVAEGMFTLIEQDVVYEATIGTGIAYSINDFLTEAFRQAGLSIENHVEFRSDFQPEYARLVSDPRTMNGLGWKAATSLEQLVELMLA
jgi:GDPmannose 4,6-dehydratase